MNPAASLSWEDLEAAGLCECGQSLSDHPPLAKPLPWSYGRPCSKTALERGYGWDGREAVSHTLRNRSRWSSLNPVPDGDEGRLTDRQREILRIVAKHDGNQIAAAAELGVAPATVSVSLARIRHRAQMPA